MIAGKRLTLQSFEKKKNPSLTTVSNPSALAAVVYVVLFFCHVDPLVLMLPALLLGKIYSNSFLLVLNSRMNIAEGRVLPTGQSESSTFAGSMLGSVVIGV